MTTDRPTTVEFRLFRQFVAVAEELHFHRAARRLGMSQPPLTASIRRLETEIGARLIERGNRTVALTAAGRALLVEARAILAQTDYALATARNAAAGRSGLVRLGYVGSAMYGRLPEAIRGFRRSHPEVVIELREATTAALVAGLRDGSIDLAVLIPPLSDDGGLVLLPFDTDRLAVAVPASHPLANASPLSLDALAEEPFVLWPAVEGRGFHHHAMRLLTGAGFTPRVVQEAHGMHAVLSLVAVEAGVSIVPASMASVRSDEIIYHPIPDAHAAFDLMLCHRAGDIEPAVAAALVAMR